MFNRDPSARKLAEAPARRRARQPGTPVVVYGAGWLALSLVVVAAVLAALYVNLDNRLQQETVQRTEAAAAELQTRLGERVAHVQQTLASLAGYPGLITAEPVRSADGPPRAPAPYPLMFPDARRLLLLPVGFQRPAPAAEPPVGFALLDLVSQAEASGTAPGPEMHLPGGAQAHVNFVQPVQQGGRVVATLVASYPPEFLGSALEIAVPGQVVLEQASSGGRVQMYRSGGEAHGPQSTRPVAGTSWRVVFRTQRAGSVLDWLPMSALLAVLGVAAAVLLLGAAGLSLGLSRAVRGDARGTARLLDELAERSLQGDYRYRLRENATELATAPDRAREILRDLASLPGAPTPPPAPAAPDISSGLEVSELPLESLPVRHRTPATPAGEPDIDPAIFRAYDIRGVVGQGLDTGVVRRIGQAIGSEAAERGLGQVVAARDGRLSSPDLFEALVEGLTASGRGVIDIGLAPTPVLYFASDFLGTGAGVMLTGSHNGPQYNGLKIVLDGQTLAEEAITALARRLKSGDLVEGEASVRSLAVVPDYIDQVAQDVTLHRPMRVVVDAGNGVAGGVAPDLLRALGCEVEELFCEVDGHFPNHHPDPSVPENLEALVRYVRLQQADLGLAFDGDADRLGVVDSAGNIIWPDRQMMLFARDVLLHHPGADVVFDVKCSRHLADVITENAGVPVMWKTGHSLIKRKLRELGAPLGGEMSGHICFADRWYGFDDALYAAARLLEILSQEGQSTAEVFGQLPDDPATPELRVPMAEGEAAALVDRLLAEADFDDGRVTTVDGLRVDLPEGFGLVRASNTEPGLVLRFEAIDQAALERLQQRFASLIHGVRPDLALPF